MKIKIKQIIAFLRQYACAYTRAYIYYVSPSSPLFLSLKKYVLQHHYQSVSYEKVLGSLA